MEGQMLGKRVGVGMIKALLAAYAVTGVLLLLLAFLMLQFELDSGKVSIGILAVYLVSCFFGGFAAGKLSSARRFLWGLAAGVGYFLILLAVSLLSAAGGGQPAGGQAVTAFVICACSGMLGGMLS